MSKLHSTIRKFSPRLARAVRVYREDPDDVVTLTEREDGSVHVSHPFGVGVAQDRQAALFGVHQMYGLITGRFAFSREGPEVETDGGPDSGGESER